MYSVVTIEEAPYTWWAGRDCLEHNVTFLDPATNLSTFVESTHSVNMDQVRSDEAASSSDGNPVASFFEKLQSAFLDEFEKDVASLSISLKKRPSQFRISSANGASNDKTLAFESSVVQKQVTYSWPGKTPYEAWKFSMCLRNFSSCSYSRQSRLRSASSLPHIRSCSREYADHQTVCSL